MAGIPQPLQRCISASTAVAQVLFVGLHGTSTHFLGEEPLLHLYSLDFSSQHFPPNVFLHFFITPAQLPASKLFPKVTMTLVINGRMFCVIVP